MFFAENLPNYILGTEYLRDAKKTYDSSSAEITGNSIDVTWVMQRRHLPWRGT